MKLEQGEIDILKQLIEDYSDCYKDFIDTDAKLNAIEKAYVKIQNQFDEVKAKLTSFRDKEKQFAKVLEDKYGKFQLNLETFEIELVEEQ